MLAYKTITLFLVAALVSNNCQQQQGKGLPFFALLVLFDHLQYLLSRFTGAARELTGALVVNPYDLEEASSALATALALPPEEQAERMRAMRQLVAEFNVFRWAGRMIVDGARVRRQGRLSDRLSNGLRTAEGA